MSWIPSSKGTALVVLVALALAMAGTAGAISVSEKNAPKDAEAGQQVEATVVIEDPFVNKTKTWTLAGNSELVGETTTWTVTVLQQGQKVSENVYEGQNFTQELNRENGGDTVRVKVSGDAPSPEGSFDYRSPQTFTLYDLDSITGNSREDLENGQKAIHYYTNASQNARSVIDDARQTINETGAGSDARDRLNQSISSFENGNFDNAKRIAKDAKSKAESAEESQQTQQLLLYGVGAVVVIGLLTGGVLYWRNQQDDYGKLQ